MANELETYYSDISKSIIQLGIDTNPEELGIAMHRVYVNGSGSASDYELTEINDTFSILIGVPKEKISGFRYSNIFPENTDSRFDWVEVLGQAGMTEARTKFYFFSEIVKKWFSILAFSPKKGYAVLVFQDITSSKIEEIKRMVVVQSQSTTSDNTN